MTQPAHTPHEATSTRLPQRLARAVELARARWERSAVLDLSLLDDLEIGLRGLNTPQREALLNELLRALGKRPGRHTRVVDAIPKPLWSLLHPDTFHKLPPHTHETLWIAATSTAAARQELSSASALAAISLWMRADEHYKNRALGLLRRQALPHQLPWLYALARQLATLDDGRHIALELAHEQLASGFVHVAASLATAWLLATHGRWISGDIERALEHACDHVALTRWREEAPWLSLIAQATLRGQLRHPWLERLIDAALRLHIQQRSEELDALRRWHATRPYHASDQRLVSLYSHLLSTHQDAALLDLTHQLSTHNPLRALRLLEVWAMLRLTPRHPGPRHRRLDQALARCAERAPNHSLTLARLYIQCAAVSRPQAAHVRRHLHQLPPSPALDDHLLMSDYVGAFEAMRADISGVSMHHADKHAAVRVAYFLERGAQGTTASLPLRDARWPEHEGVELAWLSHKIDWGLRTAQEWIGRRDGSHAALDTLRSCGAVVWQLDHIQKIPLDLIETALRGPTTRRLLLATLCGAATGALSAVGTSSMALLDTPILMAACIDTCARFCWLYGFDPRLHPELPLQILATALGGPRQHLSPDQAHQALRSLLIQRAATLAAVRRGIVSSSLQRFAGRMLGPMLTSAIGPDQAAWLSQLGRLAMAQELGRPSSPGAARTLPIVGALTGGALGAALLFDITEAAQIVLTDRFLSRKYPSWPQRLHPALITTQ